MKIIMHNTKVKLPKAPIVRPIIEINKFNVGHDFANLNTRSYLCRVFEFWIGGRMVVPKNNEKREREKEARQKKFELHN